MLFTLPDILTENFFYTTQSYSTNTAPININTTHIPHGATLYDAGETQEGCDNVDVRNNNGNNNINT
eukprot:UN09463